MDPYFETFVRDFLEELRGRVGAHTVDGLAFRYFDSIPLGAAWESNIEQALLVCRTFIAMLSPTYLQQPSCSKEWACFEWRLQTLGNAALPDLLLPLVWIPIPDRDLPPAIRSRQLTHASFGSTYASRGLRSVVQRAGAEYRDCLTALADRVRDLVHLPMLPWPLELAAPAELPDPFAIVKSPPLIHPVGSRLPVTLGPSGVGMTNAPVVMPTINRYVILFLAANPSGTTRLALDEECAALERELRMTTGRDDFEFRSKWAVSIDEMMRHFNELQPTVIHFSGHGGGSAGVHVCEELRQPHRDIGVVATAGIQLQDEQRQPQHVSARALTQMIGSAAPSARLVVLNACFSDAVAEELCSVVDCVVGMRGAISDDAARSFAVGFYRALGHRRSVGNALAQAVATLAAKQLPDEQLPICLTRDGINADHVTLPRLGLHRV
jgi:CHAT domain/TIR domain